MVFLNYRTKDVPTWWTGWPSSSAAPRRRRVFKDTRDLEPGERWPARLRAEVLRCDAFLAVIGPTWHTQFTEFGGPRLWDPEDWVRAEICTAIDHGKRVIVLLVTAPNRPTAAPAHGFARCSNCRSSRPCRYGPPSTTPIWSG